MFLIQRSNLKNINIQVSTEMTKSHIMLVTLNTDGGVYFHLLQHVGCKQTSSLRNDTKRAKIIFTSLVLISFKSKIID